MNLVVLAALALLVTAGLQPGGLPEYRFCLRSGSGEVGGALDSVSAARRYPVVFLEVLAPVDKAISRRF